MKARYSTLFATVMILIASSASAARWVIPAAAHAVGSGGTNWRTDLRIVNSDATVAAVRLYLLPAATDNGGLDRSTDLTVPAGGQLKIADVLESRFSFAGTAALLVESDSDGLVVTSRTYNLAPGGTYGQFIPGVSTRRALQPGETGHLVGLAKSDDLRSNLGFAGVSTTPATVSVTLVDRDGRELGFGTFALPPFGQHQVNDVFAAVGAPPAAAATAGRSRT